jgi:hypothetical protein
LATFIRCHVLHIKVDGKSSIVQATPFIFMVNMLWLKKSDDRRKSAELRNMKDVFSRRACLVSGINGARGGIAVPNRGATAP